MPGHWSSERIRDPRTLSEHLRLRKQRRRQLRKNVVVSLHQHFCAKRWVQGRNYRGTIHIRAKGTTRIPLQHGYPLLLDDLLLDVGRKSSKKLGIELRDWIGGNISTRGGIHGGRIP